jgi:hypothetical protein
MGIKITYKGGEMSKLDIQINIDWSIAMLTLLFVALKLIGVISWSWWWVLSPLWISFVIGIILAVLAWKVTE